ncbi:MAG TPA: ATP-binding protein [Clostridia bacterium]|nr:ATP-binding protein [Clostridia bacterium]
MKIAVLSGKGGTGKTTVATNMAFNFKGAVLVDADVEEPNSHIFIKPKATGEKSVYKNFPVVDMDRCNLCGDCGRFCKYNAILPAKNKVLVFKEICHDCGGCEIVCKRNAISYEKREIGKIHSGKGLGGINFIYGDLNVGEVSGVKIISELREIVSNDEVVIIDSPPGTSCASVESVEGVDYAIVVSEPTPFGVSDMKMVVEMLENMKIPFGVVVNKAGLGNDEIYDYCLGKNIEILENIPFSEEIAKLYAVGEMMCLENSKYSHYFENIIGKIIKTVK